MNRSLFSVSKIRASSYTVSLFAGAGRGAVDAGFGARDACWWRCMVARLTPASVLACLVGIPPPSSCW